MSGLFITFEGTEGGGKSTQIARLAERLSARNFKVRSLREPGGTPIGEEIRHTLKHSASNHAMTSEAELLLMNASRAQLVREVIRPALAHGRQLDLPRVRSVIQFAVGETIPNLTLLLRLPIEVSEARRVARGAAERDRFEEADREFFRRVEQGYDAIARSEPQRVKVIDATRAIKQVGEDIWREVEPLLSSR
jgi:dTMP kinase